MTVTDHQLRVYDDDDGLLTIARRIGRSELASGHSVVLIAGAVLLSRLATEIDGTDLDLADLISARRYLALDAHELLELRLDGRVEGIVRFRKAFRTAIEHAPARRVLVLTELASILSGDGRFEEAAMFEGWLNEIARKPSFALRCLSRLSNVVSEHDLGGAGRICALHSSIHSPPSYLGGAIADHLPFGPTSVEHVVLPVPEAIGAVRRFVDRALRVWRLEERSADAVLVASELATNAIRYSGAPFHVRVERRVSSIEVSVRDLTSAMPVRRSPSALQPDGRGIALVETISNRWGVRTLADGKVVWAEMDL